MITGITGIISGKGESHIEVVLGGAITIQVLAPANVIQKSGSPGESVHLYTQFYMKNDEPVLYGFFDTESVHIFQMLNTVSGIGPRTSLAVLSSLEPHSLISAVSNNDVQCLNDIPGIGPKTAARILLELRGKIGKHFGDHVYQPIKYDQDILAAVMALGYSANEIRRAMADIENLDGLSLEDNIRQVLRILAS